MSPGRGGSPAGTRRPVRRAHSSICETEPKPWPVVAERRARLRGGPRDEVGAPAARASPRRPTRARYCAMRGAVVRAGRLLLHAELARRRRERPQPRLRRAVAPGTRRRRAASELRRVRGRQRQRRAAGHPRQRVRLAADRALRARGCACVGERLANAPAVARAVAGSATRDGERRDLLHAREDVLDGHTAVYSVAPART